MLVRVNTIDAPRFRHKGLDITDAWTQVDTDALTAEGRAALVEYRGRILRIHEADAVAFNAEFGAPSPLAVARVTGQATVKAIGEQPPTQPQPVTSVPDQPIASQRPITPEAGGPPRKSQGK